MMQTTDTAVRREVTVQAPPERAFAVFTEGFDTWWPREFSIASADLAEAIIEPREGGRFYERGVDGSECVWGEVLRYDPPNRLTLTWRIAGDWQLDDAASEIDVTFTPTGDGATHVQLEHRHLERHRAAEALRGAIGGDGGWGGLLTRYSDAVAG